MQLTSLQIMGLLALVAIIPVYQGYRNWRLHTSWQQLATVRGWRYTQHSWKAIFRAVCSMAGTTPSGIVWHLKQRRQNRKILFVWSASNSLLPYGRLVILPQAAPLAGSRGLADLRQLSKGDEIWRLEYALWSTHDILGGNFFNRELEQRLLDWPKWPSPGALEEIVWIPGQLRIHGRYHHDILALERIVDLGTALLENAVRRREKA